MCALQQRSKDHDLSSGKRKGVESLAVDDRQMKVVGASGGTNHSRQDGLSPLEQLLICTPLGMWSKLGNCGLSQCRLP